MVSPDQQRAAADYLDERYEVSQRRISRVMGRSRSGLRYRRKRRPDEPVLNREIKRLAQAVSPFRIPSSTCRVGPAWMVSQCQTGEAALEQPGTEEAREAEKTPKIRP